MVAKRAVYVVDDEAAIRRSLNLMLTVQGYAATAFESGPALLDAVDSLAAGTVLLDVRMPEMDGIEVQRRLVGRGAGLPVVVMAGHGDLAIAVAAMQNGAVAFIEKPFTGATLRRALHAAFLKLEDPAGYGRHLEEVAAGIRALGEKDRTLLARLAAGLSNEAIANEIGGGLAGVEVRRARLLADLGAENLSDLLRMAFAAGLGPPGYATLPNDS